MYGVLKAELHNNSTLVMTGATFPYKRALLGFKSRSLVFELSSCYRLLHLRSLPHTADLRRRGQIYGGKFLHGHLYIHGHPPILPSIAMRPLDGSTTYDCCYDFYAARYLDAVVDGVSDFVKFNKSCHQKHICSF